MKTPLFDFLKSFSQRRIPTINPEEFRRLADQILLAENKRLFDENKKLKQQLGEASSQTIITDEHRAALKLIDSGAQLILITGSAGTGKTYFLRELLVKHLNKRHIIVAPTGIAAIQAGGSTIHSALDIKTGTPARPNGNNTKTNLNELELLIIDEISMVRADLFDAIHDRLIKCGPRKGKPFGGVQIIMIGDLYQLPPVLVANDHYSFISANYNHEACFFFDAHCLNDSICQIKHIELTQPFRQIDTEFLKLLNNIRIGSITNEDLKILNRRKAEPPPATPIISTHNKTVDAENARHLKALKSKEYVFPIETRGIVPPSHPFPEALKVKVGARVMFVVNDTGTGKEPRWVNGTTGTIIKISSHEELKITVKLDSGKTHHINKYVQPFFSWEYIDGRYERVKEGEIIQFPLTLAWAATVHKSQGRTLSRVHVKDANFFAEGQAYVALSRCKAINDLYLSKKVALADIKVNSHVKEFLENISK